MSDLSYLARRQYRINSLLKKIDAWKKELRKEFFAAADERFSQESHLLPMTSIKVPQRFFEITGMSHEEFLHTRYPSYSQVALSEEDNNFIFILRKKREYMSFSHADEDYELSRSVSEFTPEIDWESMKAVDPQLFEAFAIPEVTYKLDADAFQRFVAEDNKFDAQNFLSRYAVHKPPALRILSKEVKKDE